MRVRFLVQDVSTGDHLSQDEEIQWTLAEYPNVFEAASVVARSIGGKLAQRPTAKTVQDATISWQGRSQQYYLMADKLQRKANDPSNRQISVYAGGISKADKEAQAQDTDWAKGAFAVGMQSWPGSTAVDWIQPST